MVIHFPVHQLVVQVGAGARRVVTGTNAAAVINRRLSV
ncbi:hypothetical protein L841_4309 [Mycobacterium sp. MAC_080597_8934]|nr:hypothetical protein L842_0789 [Mycobacterium intracellulare MIN_052511_1280]ETZ60142.1 hypothetical protein L841_4309 [Mycobacterium sp. MAC_080597_8934]